MISPLQRNLGKKYSNAILDSSAVRLIRSGEVADLRAGRQPLGIVLLPAVCRVDAHDLQQDT